MKRDSLASLLAVVSFSLIWGYNWVVMKKALAYAAALDFAALRTGLGAASLFAVMWVLNKPLRLVAAGPTLLLGLLQTALFTALVNAALTMGDVGKAAVLTYTMPFWALLLSRMFLDERIARAQWPPIILALAGLLIILGGALRSPSAAALPALAAGISWAAAAVVAKRIRQKGAIDLISLTAWQMLFGAVALSLLAWTIPSRPIEWSPYFIAALAYNAVLATALAWLLWLFVLGRHSAGMAGMATLAIPVIGVLAASAQLGERPAAAEALGMLAIGLGLALLPFATGAQASKALAGPPDQPRR